MIKDTSQSDLTILINNLRIKTEVAPSKLCFNGCAPTIDSYMAGELIQYDNLKKLGYVIQTSPESLTVLTESNQLEFVKTQEVTRKVQQGKFSNGVDSENNVIAFKTLIKIRDRNDPMRG